MGSAHNVHPELGLWSNVGGKTGCVVAFILCGLIASSSGLVLQMTGHDANIDGRSVIAAMPLNPGALVSTIVTAATPVPSVPDSRQVTAASPSSPQTVPVNAIPPAVTVSNRQTTTELGQQPVAVSNFRQTAPANTVPTAVTGSAREATTARPEQPAAPSNSPQAAPLNASPQAATAATGETTRLPQWPAAASSDSQKPVRSSNQRKLGRYDAAGWGRYAHERPSSGW